jgi:D-arabinose 1-dehydrogenase-like Zn-dependent alcohol dehydrogenase
VAVHGIGGLGHLGIQFASRMGFHTVAIGRGKDKEALALKLEAARYLDTNTDNVAKQLTSLGGASVILATVPDGKAMSPLIDGLGVGGQLLVGGLGRSDQYDTDATHRPAPVHSRLAVRDRQRFGRHAQFLQPHGDSSHD